MDALNTAAGCRAIIAAERLERACRDADRQMAHAQDWLAEHVRESRADLDAFAARMAEIDREWENL